MLLITHESSLTVRRWDERKGCTMYISYGSQEPRHPHTLQTTALSSISTCLVGAGQLWAGAWWSRVSPSSKTGSVCLTRNQLFTISDLPLALILEIWRMIWDRYSSWQYSSSCPWSEGADDIVGMLGPSPHLSLKSLYSRKISIIFRSPPENFPRYY